MNDIKKESDKRERSVSWMIAKVLKEWIENNKNNNKKKRAGK